MGVVTDRLAPLRFLLVGGASAALNLVVLWALTSVLGLHYLLSNLISFVTLNLGGYLANKVYTFRLTRQVQLREVARYFAVATLGLCINLACLWAMVHGLGLHYLAGAVVMTAVLAPLNYLAHRDVTYETPTVSAAGPPPPPGPSPR